MNPFEQKPKKSYMDLMKNWKGIEAKPYDKLEADPYTKARIILMNGTEFEAALVRPPASTAIAATTTCAASWRSLPPRGTAAAKARQLSKAHRRDAAGTRPSATSSWPWT